MNDLELRVRVEAEVAAARREINSLKGEVAAFGQAAKTAAGVSMQDLVGQFAGVRQGATSAKDSALALLAGLQDAASGYDMLRASVDPAYAATQRFADAQTVARIAVANGITTEQEAARTLDLLAQKLGLVEGKSELAGAALGRVNMSSGAAAAASANLAYQFNDVAVMAAAGQNPLMIAIQQGTQIGQVMGQSGAAGAMGLLKAGFMAFLSPQTLVIGALIAGGAALLQWAMGADDAASATEDLDDAIDSLREVTDNYTEGSLERLKTKYGAVDAALLQFLDRQRQHALQQAQEKANSAVDNLTTGVPGLETAEGRGFVTLMNQLGMTADQVNNLRDAVRDVRAAMTFDDKAAALAKLDSLLASSAMAGSDLAIEVTSAGLKMREVANSAQVTEGKIGGADDSARGLARTIADALAAMVDLKGSAPGSGWLAGAIGDAETLAAKLWNAAAAAAAAAATKGSEITNMNFPDYVAGNNGLPIRSPFGSIPSGLGTAPIVIETPGSGSSSGSGGGSRSSTNSLADLSAQARKAISDLDLAIAAINAKVQTGLMSTADAADAVASAKGRAADELAGLVVQMDQLGPAGDAAADQVRDNMKGLAADLKVIGSDLTDTLADGFKSPFKDFLLGAKSAEEAMDDLGAYFKDALAQMAADAAVNDLFKPLLGMLGSGFADIAGGLFGGGAAAAPSRGMSRGMSARPDWDAGIMRRAPVALTRAESVGGGLAQAVGGSGRMAGDGAPRVVVNVTTPPGTTAKVEERSVGNDLNVEVMVEMVENRMAGNLRAGRGSHAAALAETFGMERRPR